MIYLYDKTETNFAYNGKPLSKAYDVLVDYSVNDEYYVTGKYPLDESETYKELQEDNILKVHTPDGMQPFRIIDTTKYMGYVEFEAWPLFYADMRNKLVRPLQLRNANFQTAIAQFNSHLLQDISFELTTNITERHDYHTQDEDERESNPNQLYDAMEVFKELVVRWNGEVSINGYDIRVLDRIGSDKEALLYEKKNIAEFIDKQSIADLVTRVHGKSEWTESTDDGEQIDHKLSATVDSPLINAYSGIIFEKQYTNNDIRTEQELKNWLNLKFTTENIDKPKRNIEISTNVVDGQEIHSGDGLVLKYLKHDVDMQIRMIGYQYDGFANRYITVYLGDAKDSLAGSIKNSIDNVENNVKDIKRTVADVIVNSLGQKIIYSEHEPTGNFRDGDIWFDADGGMYKWDEETADWIPHPYNRRNDIVATAIEELEQDLERHRNRVEADMNDFRNLVDSSFQSIEGTIEDIESVATNAQSDARQALNDLIGMSDRLNGVDGDINDINVDINELEGTLNVHAGQLSQIDGDISYINNELSIQAGELQSKITRTEMDEAIDGIEIGGRNLVSDSGEERSASYMANGIYYEQDLSNILGTTVTVSFEARQTDPNDTFYVGIAKNAGNTEQRFHDGDLSVGEGYERISFTINVSQNIEANGIWFVNRESNRPENAGTLYIKNVKLEKGNKATDWTPAPEDTIERFDYFSNELIQTEERTLNRISTVQNDLDGTVTKVNEIESTVDGTVQNIAEIENDVVTGFNRLENSIDGTQNTVSRIDDELGTVSTQVTNLADGFNVLSTNFANLKVGGRNYIPNSSEEMSRSGANSHFGYEFSGNDLVEGEIVTISFDARSDVYSFPMDYYFRAGSTNNLPQPQIYVNSEYSRYSVQMIVPEWKDDIETMHFRPRSGGTLYIRNVKLEKGNKATDWTPAPEDMASQAQFTVLNDNINARVSKGELMSQINIEAGRTLIQSDRLYLDAQSVVFSGSAFIPSAAIEDLSADKITTGTLNAANLNVINLNTNDIAGLNSEFVTSNWNNYAGGSVQITSYGLVSTATNGSQSLVQNGVFLSRNTGGNTIGYIGVNNEAQGLFYTITTSLGTNFRIRGHMGGNAHDDLITIYPGSSETSIRTERTNVSTLCVYDTLQMHSNAQFNLNTIYGMGKINFDTGTSAYIDSIKGGSDLRLSAREIVFNSGSSRNTALTLTDTNVHMNKQIRMMGVSMLFDQGGEVRSTNGHIVVNGSGGENVSLDVGSNRIFTISSSSAALHRTLYMNGNEISGTSDKRLKDIVGDYDAPSLSVIKAVNYKRFRFKGHTESTYGIIAQQALAVGADFIGENPEGFLTLENTKYTHSIGHAVQQLSRLHDDLNKNFVMKDIKDQLFKNETEQRLSYLEEENKLLKEEITQLKGA